MESEVHYSKLHTDPGGPVSAREKEEAEEERVFKLRLFKSDRGQPVRECDGMEPAEYIRRSVYILFGHYGFWYWVDHYYGRRGLCGYVGFAYGIVYVFRNCYKRNLCFWLCIAEQFEESQAGSIYILEGGGWDHDKIPRFYGTSAVAEDDTERFWCVWFISGSPSETIL